MLTVHHVNYVAKSTIVATEMKKTI